MEPQLQDDKLIARYLLGELSEDEQVQLEEHAFSDTDYLERVRAVEKDLIDEYARGELSGSVRQSFEQRFLASEPRRRQIEFARAFTQTIDGSPSSAPSNEAAQATSSRHSLVSFWRGQRLAFGFSLAVVALGVVIGGVWLLKQRAQSQREQAQRRSPQATPSVQQSTTPKFNDEQRVTNEPRPVPSPAQPQDTHQPSQPVVASLLLLPGTSRGAESHSQLVITPGTKLAQLRVALEKGDEYQTYALELRTGSGKLIRSQAGLQAHAGHGGRAVLLTLPANILTTGDYELTLNGINDQKRVDPLGYCYFSVRKE
jgi:anti-sigma factor RsiW